MSSRLAGWRWKEQPALACALHVGDRVASVAGVAVTSAAEFGRLVKQQQAPVVCTQRRTGGVKDDLFIVDDLDA